MASNFEAQARGCYAALNRRDFDAFVGFFHPDAEIRSLVMEADGAVYRGRDGMRRFAEDLLAVFPDWHAEVERVDDVAGFEGVAILAVRVGGTATGSGVEVGMQSYAAIAYAEGMATRVIFHRTESDALAALRATSG